MKLGRNDPCHCDSGQKYKKCCAAKDASARSVELAARQAELSAAHQAAVAEEEAKAAAEGAAGDTATAESKARAKRPKLPTAHAARGAR
jgi:hypothetical protein